MPLLKLAGLDYHPYLKYGVGKHKIWGHIWICASVELDNSQIIYSSLTEKKLFCEEMLLNSLNRLKYKKLLLCLWHQQKCFIQQRKWQRRQMKKKTYLTAIWESDAVVCLAMVYTCFLDCKPQGGQYYCILHFLIVLCPLTLHVYNVGKKNKSKY